MKKVLFSVLVVVAMILTVVTAMADTVDDQFCCGRAWYEVNGKYGYIDTQGNNVIPAQWDYASSFYESGYAYVFNGTLNQFCNPDIGLYGIIDVNGDYFLPMQFCDGISLYDSHNTGRYYITYELADLVWQYEHRTFDGKVIGNKRWDNSRSGSLPMPVAEGKDSNQKWGYATEDGMMLPCQYSDAFEFVNGIAKVEVANVKGQKNHVFINMSGEQIISGDWDYAYNFTKEGYARVFKGTLSNYGSPEKGKYAFINTHGEFICDYIFDDAKDFSQGYAPVATQSVKGGILWGYIDGNGQLAIAQQWDYAYPFKNGFARVFSGSIGKYGPDSGLYGFINLSGDFISDIQWASANDFDDTGIAKVKNSKDLWGYISIDGSVKIDTSWETIGSFNEGLAYVKKNGKYGYINEQGTLVVEASWNEAGTFADGVAIVHDSKTWYVIDKEGAKVF